MTDYYLQLLTKYYLLLTTDYLLTYLLTGLLTDYDFNSYCDDYICDDGGNDYGDYELRATYYALRLRLR